VVVVAVVVVVLVVVVIVSCGRTDRHDEGNSAFHNSATAPTNVPPKRWHFYFKVHGVTSHNATVLKFAQTQAPVWAPESVSTL
jgi:hypothetical protein